MERYTHQQNLAHYRRLLAESERDPARNEVQHNWLLKLLADEEATPSRKTFGINLQRPFAGAVTP
jgi:hypothetical protein